MRRTTSETGRGWWWCVWVWGAWMASGAGGSQAEAQGIGRAAGGESPRAQMAAEFERKAPAIGDPLPDLKALDADGRELRLRSLRGKHTVLVFGCLT